MVCYQKIKQKYIDQKREEDISGYFKQPIYTR